MWQISVSLNVVSFPQYHVRSLTGSNQPLYQLNVVAYNSSQHHCIAQGKIIVSIEFHDQISLKFLSMFILLFTEIITAQSSARSNI